VQCSQIQDLRGARRELLPEDKDTKSLSDSCERKEKKYSLKLLTWMK
jgi:hypothetical protein